ncbi:MAG: ATP-dependent Clp protease ATP-binding subunit [Ruminococcaceae bacterium]|nr:ATP-dependent Clp protease ATP-binding subunit [Oscillospiraceae bacterium]
MKRCTRCNKRPAVVFITRLEGEKSVSEGLCIRCAREIGITQVDDIIKQSGISEEDLDRLDGEIESLIEMNTDDVEESEEGKTPQIDFNRLFGGMMFRGNDGMPMPQKEGSQEQKSKNKQSKKSEEEEREKRKYLTAYCRNLTEMAKQGKIDKTVGRDKEIARLMQILCRRQKNNPCLIGEPGVGKTAIAEALATRIAEENVPQKLAYKEVHLLDLTALVAGTQFRGQFESRIKGLIEEVKKLGNIILVIDEVHTIVGAGDAEGGMNAANILKPALSRGEIQVIGATTLAEYRKYIEKDAALERRFQPIIVEEPSIADTVEILRGIKGYYETHHGIKIPEGLLERAVVLSERYITDRFLPDKAIDLLDESSSYLALNSDVINELQKVTVSLEKVKKEREAIEGEIAGSEAPDEEKYRTLATLKSDEMRLFARFEELSKERDGIVLTVNELAYVIELWTGVPATNITEMEFKRIDQLSDRIKKHIVGQDDAVEAVVRAIKRNRAGVSYKRKPVSFIFAGPTGVGKTELVKTIAADLFSQPESLVRLDMSEFMEKHSVSRIVGSPPGYVGYDDAGQLTEKIRRKPYSVVLFDEIEKAHPDVMNILLQILDDGRITDAQGRTVNFENTVIVMTTNAGSVGVSGLAGFSTTASENSSSKTEKALSQFLRPEFLNRVDEIITFRSLDIDDFGNIARIMLDELKSAMKERGVNLEYSEEAAKYIAKQSFDTKYGARNMRRYIQKHIEDEIANYIISNYEELVDYIGIGYDENSDKLDIKYLKK